MNKRSVLLKKIAKRVIHDNAISNETAKRLITQLTRREKKELLQYLRNEYAMNTVTVTTAEKPSSDVTKTILSTFKDKNIVYNVDEKITGGIVIQVNDDVFDASIRNYLAQTIEQLQN